MKVRSLFFLTTSENSLLVNVVPLSEKMVLGSLKAKNDLQRALVVAKDVVELVICISNHFN